MPKMRDKLLHRRAKAFIWPAKSTPRVGFPHGSIWLSRVVHSLFKEYYMRKIILAAAVAGAALSLSACKGGEAASSADSATSADSAASADSSAASGAASDAAPAAGSAAADAASAASSK